MLNDLYYKSIMLILNKPLALLRNHTFFLIHQCSSLPDIQALSPSFLFTVYLVSYLIRQWKQMEKFPKIPSQYLPLCLAFPNALQNDYPSASKAYYSILMPSIPSTSIYFRTLLQPSSPFSHTSQIVFSLIYFSFSIHFCYS